MTIEYAHVLPRRGTAATWTSVNPVLLMGEEGLETDTGRTKRGDGATTWAALPYDLDAATASSTYALLSGFVHYAPASAVDDATDTANLQAAINAAFTAGGGTVVLQEGVYIAHGLVPKSGVTIRGAGRGLTKLRTMTAAGDLFISPASTNGMVFDSLSLQSVGGGNVFSGVLYQSVFRDCAFYQNVDAKCVFDVTGWIDNLITNCDFTHTLTATGPTFRAVSATADIAAFTFDSSRFTNTGNYAIWLEGTSGAFCHNPTIRNVTFEIANGGAINLLSCKNARVDTCGVHDLSATTTHHLLNIDTSPTAGAPSRSATIIGWTRDSGATALGSGLYDINSSAYDTVIIGASRYPAGSMQINMNLGPGGVVIGDEATLTQGDYVTHIGASVVRTGAASTAGRPTPSAAGRGAQFFDTTIGKPIWSDGYDWRDAAGTVV